MVERPRRARRIFSSVRAFFDCQAFAGRGLAIAEHPEGAEAPDGHPGLQFGRGRRAEHDAPGAAVHPVPDGLEGYRGHGRGGDGEADVRAGAVTDGGADPCDHGRVDGGGQSRQRSEHDGLADQDVDVVQAVSEHGDACGDRDERDRHDPENARDRGGQAQSLKQVSEPETQHQEGSRVGQPFEPLPLCAAGPAEPEDERGQRGEEHGSRDAGGHGVQHAQSRLRAPGPERVADRRKGSAEAAWGQSR